MHTNDDPLSPQNEAERTLRYIQDIIKEGVWDWDAQTGKVERSPGWYRMLGYDVGIFPKNVFTWENIIHPDDYQRVMQHFEDYIKGHLDYYAIEYRCRKADGDYLWVRDQGKIVERNEDGSVARMIGAHLNIHIQRLAQEALEHQNELLYQDKFTLENLIKQRTGELEEANRKLKDNLEQIDRLSNRDFLTGLYNRQKLEQELQRELGRAKRYSTALSVALYDIDHFKPINDTYGHHAGDSVLKKVSELVLYNIRDTDILGRWGGDEFLIILPGIDADHAVAFIDKIRHLIAESILLSAQQVTCSFGVTQYMPDDTLESIYKRGDNALYQAKAAGRNVVMSC